VAVSTVPWAPDLPQCFLRESYQLQPTDNVLREEMEIGPPKQRRRSTVQVVHVQASMQFTAEQRRNFLIYYRKVILEGTVAFALEDPDGIVQHYTMTAPPSLAPQGTGWRCAMALQYIERN
jgi:hypothetical protein